MRLRGRIDANQPAIVKALRQIGCGVASIAKVGRTGGIPDLIVASGGRTVLIEVKDPSKPPSARKLTEDESSFHRAWPGEIFVVETPEQAVSIFLRHQP
jgi:hypothetical protein